MSRLWSQLKQSPVATRVLGAAALAAAFAGALASLHIGREGGITSENVLSLLWCYWLPSLLVWLALIVLLARLLERHSKVSTLPQNAVAILGVALVIRLFVVFTTQPQLSDDLWRYIHDGQSLLNGVSPYAQAPAASHLPVARYVNHPELITIYQPTSQVVFAVLAAVARVVGSGGDSGGDPGGDRVFRLGFVLFDMLIVGLLLVKLRDEGRPPWWATLYAWHPLAISEVAASGHQDVIGVALLLTSLVLSDRIGVKRWAAAGSGVAFAAAVAVKPVILPLALVLVWSHRKQLRELAVATLAAVVTLLALYLPFVLTVEGVAGHLSTLSTFMRDWRFNGSLHPILEWMLGSKLAADWAAVTLLMLFVVGAISWLHDRWKICMLVLGVALLLSSTVHPWYLLWAMPLVAVRFEAWLWLWSLTIGWSYMVLSNPLAWYLPRAVTLAEYGLVYVVAVAALAEAAARRISNRV